jgi:CubicO group peptidase (beta-lactamase class C family)
MEVTIRSTFSHSVRLIIAGAIARRVFPGAVVLAGEGEQLLHASVHGTTMYADAGSIPVTLDTIYDIASLTKVFTATAALRLLDAGALALDDPAARFLPALAARDVRIRHLLTHTSGLEVRLSTLRHLPPDDLRAAVYAELPQQEPGRLAAYANVSSLLLGDLVAQVWGGSLDAALYDLVSKPLGLQTLCFNPPAALLSRIAPTEVDEAWRGLVVRGVAHDDSAFALGGVAGHAGLFSDAHDLARFLIPWLNDGVAEGRQFLHPETVQAALRSHTAGLAVPANAPTVEFGLGWMLRRPDLIAGAPDDTFCHTGFTGPVMLGVPGARQWLVILSNRTYPRRTPAAHHDVTAAVLRALREGDWR